MTMDKKTLIKTAYLHFKDGQWDHAIEQYQKLLALDPSDILALNMLGDVYSRQGRVTEALQYYKQALRIFKEQNAADKIDIIQRKMSKLDPNSVEEEPPAAAAKSRPAENIEDAGLREAIDGLKSKIAADAKNLDNYQKLGDLLAKAGRNSEAAEQYLAIANAFYNNRLFKKATPIFEHIISIDPGNLQAHITLGEIYSKEGMDSEAKKEFLFVAENLIRQGNLDRGQLFAQKAIQLKSIEAHYYLGLVYYMKNQINEAKSEFETLLKFKINHQGALTHLAQIVVNAGQLEEGYGFYERLLKVDSKNSDAVEKMAEVALRLGRNDQARQYFVTAMERFAADEQWEHAAACASQAVKLDPQNAELYLKLADAAYNAGLEQQAAEACMALADIYASQGKTSEAEQMRAKGRELLGEAPAPPVSAAPPPPKAEEKPLSPADEAKVMLNIAANYIRQGSLDEAIEIYQKILKRDPNNDEVKTALTRAYAMFAGVNPDTALAKKGAPVKSPASPGEEPEEQRVQREARERAQREAQVRSQRSAVVEKPAMAKTPGKEIDLFQAVEHKQETEIGGDHQDEFMTVTVAEIYTKQGLLNEALKIYQKILEIEPGNLEAKMKKEELEKNMVEQERLRVQSEEAAKVKRAQAEKEAKRQAAQAEKAPAPPSAPEKSAPPEPEASSPKSKPDDNDQSGPSGPGRRGRVSYV